MTAFECCHDWLWKHVGWIVSAVIHLSCSSLCFSEIHWATRIQVIRRRGRNKGWDWGIGQALALSRRLGQGRRKPAEFLDPAASPSGHRHRTQSCRLTLASFLPWKMHTKSGMFTFPSLYGILPSCGRCGCNGNKYWHSLNWRLLSWVTYAPWIACIFVWGVFF